MKNKSFQKISLLVLGVAVLPSVAFAQSFQFFYNIIGFIQDVLSFAFPIVTAILIILFGYYLIRFLLDKKNIEESDNFKKGMIRAFIAVFMWFILIGAINTIAGALNINVGEDAEKTTGVKFK